MVFIEAEAVLQGNTVDMIEEVEFIDVDKLLAWILNLRKRLLLFSSYNL